MIRPKSEATNGCKMGWNRWYVTGSYLRSALWIVPLIALVLEQVTIRVLARLDLYLGFVPQLATTAAGVIGEMDTVITLTGSFIVFTFGSMLVAIQVAGGQLTPRIIATTLLQDNTIRFTVGLFVFTLLFAVGTKAQIGPDIPQFEVTVTAMLGIACMAAFLYLIDYTARLLRPISIVWRIAEKGINVVRTVYPDTIKSPHVPRAARQPPGPADRIVEHRGTSAIVLAVNLKKLVAVAQRANGVVEFAPRVGSFVATEEPLFRLYGGAAAIKDNVLRAQVAFGPERTIEQDSTFAFRVIVDVAIKALSKAINDPTTAVLAIDQLHRLLRQVGRRHLHDDALYDADRKLRLILRTPDWQDFVDLTFSEIRLYGAENFQIARRLRAMIDDLSNTLPEARQTALRRELALLDRTLERLHAFPEDLALARLPDIQGLGGASVSNQNPQCAPP
jgi:uncharacterized membrane protein